MIRQTYKGMSRAANKRVPTDDGHGTKLVPNGRIVGDIEVEINIQKIAEQLGHKALKASSKKSVLGGGLIVVRARNVKHEGGTA